MRSVFSTESGVVYGFYADRVAFLETNPHDINRVVQVEFESLPTVPRVGDVLRISTRFQGISEASSLQVPNWPHDRYFEYPIARHALTSAEPVP